MGKMMADVAPSPAEGVVTGFLRNSESLSTAQAGWRTMNEMGAGSLICQVTKEQVGKSSSIALGLPSMIVCL